MTPKPGFFKPESPAIIRAAEDVYRLIRSLSRRMRESVYTLLLDPENALIEMEEISRGSTGLADAYPVASGNLMPSGITLFNIAVKRRLL